MELNSFAKRYPLKAASFDANQHLWAAVATASIALSDALLPPLLGDCLGAYD